MPAPSENAKIRFASQRAKLPIQPEPHWHQLAEGQHLGYRKTGDRKGTWIARLYTREHGRRFKSLGAADDVATADNTHVFDFDHAQDDARKWFNEVLRSDNAGVHIGPYKVKDAAADWIKVWDGSEAGKRNAESNLKHHILPTLGDVEMSKLARHQVQDWLHDLAKKPPMKSLSKKSKVKFDPNDPETIRKRRDTANRIFNDLSALLTLAYDNQHVASKAAWETVEKFENVDVAKNEYLTLKEAQNFLKVCPQDFKDLVQAALITGCRYNELARLKVKAYDVQLRAISLIQGKTGKMTHKFLTDEEAAFFDKKIKDKRPDDPLFMRDDVDADGKPVKMPWNKSNQQPRMKETLKAAGISRHVRFHDLRHTFATLLVMNGTSIPLIANQLGHSGTRIAEKHYAHFSPSFVAATVRANKPSFGFEGTRSK